MAKGMELPLNAIVLLILVLIVLLIITLYLSGSGKQLFGKMSALGEEAATTTQAGDYGKETSDLTKTGWGVECNTEVACPTGKTCTEGKCV